MMSPAEIKAMYANALSEIVTVRRYTGSGANRPHFDADARARVVGFSPVELVGSIVQGDTKIILFADDLLDVQFAQPVTVNDKVVVRGKELAIIASDDSTRRVDGVLIAYEIQARG